MGIEGEPPTAEQTAYIRNKVANYIGDNGKGIFITFHFCNGTSFFKENQESLLEMSNYALENLVCKKYLVFCLKRSMPL